MSKIVYEKLPTFVRIRQRSYALSGQSGGKRETRKESAPMIDWLKCVFGLHDWSWEFAGNRYGHRAGDKCLRCGVWHKDSAITEYRDHDDQ